MKTGGVQHKMKVLSLVDHATGRSRSMVLDTVTIASITPIVRANSPAKRSL